MTTTDLRNGNTITGFGIGSITDKNPIVKGVTKLIDTIKKICSNRNN